MYVPKLRHPVDPDTVKLTMPTRFVVLPIEQAREWMSRFAQQVAYIDDTLAEFSADVQTRSLRIEREYLSCIFEKVWERQDERNLLLQRTWDAVWLDMGRALREAPVLDRPVKEDFRTEEPDILGCVFSSEFVERVIPGIGDRAPEK